MKTAFSCILNAIIGCVGVKWNRAIFQSMGGGGDMGFANRGPKRGSGGPRVWEGETPLPR